MPNVGTDRRIDGREHRRLADVRPAAPCLTRSPSSSARRIVGGDRQRRRLGSGRRRLEPDRHGELSPGATVNGKLSTCAIWNSLDDDEMPLMVSGHDAAVADRERQIPELRGPDAQLLRSCRCPRSPSPQSATRRWRWPRRAGTGKVRIVAGDRQGGVVFGPGDVGLNAIWNGKQKSWLMVTGNPADGATTVKSGFDEAIAVHHQIARARVADVQRVRSPSSPAHDGAKNGGAGTWISGIATFLNVSRHAPRPRVPRYRLMSPAGGS